MGSKSDYLERRLLDLVLGGVSYSPPATIYLALFTGSASEGAVMAEVGGGDYARLGIPNTLAQWPSASGNPSLKVNASSHSFPMATADWGRITDWALMDSQTAGNALYYGKFLRPRDIFVGDTVVVAAGTIRITED